MNLEMLKMLHHYSNSLKSKWNPLVMELGNSFGPDSKDKMVNGLGLTLPSWLKRERSTLTKFTLGPNTITIRTTTTLPKSKETTSNTTIPTTSPSETDVS